MALGGDYKGTSTDSSWHRFLRRLGFRCPPVIHVGGEAVPESKRLQAATNMRLKPEVKQRVVDLIGETEARKRYPEGFE